MNFNPFHKKIENSIESYIGYENDIEQLIKDTLINDENFDEDNWEDFVDGQKIGDCQLIVSFIQHNFPHIKKVFGEIEVDEPYIDHNGDEQIYMTHHWIEINDIIYDFSKGTLVDYIEWMDKYDPDCSLDEWRYNSISK